MADTQQTQALIILAQNYAGDIVRQANRQSVALRLLPMIQGEGKNCAWVAELSGAVAESFSEGALVTNFGSDAQISALLTWGEYRANFHVSGLAQAVAATSRTPMGNIQLWARNMTNAATKLASLLNTEFYTGAGTTDLIAGLDQAIGSTTNTYAGVDRSQAANALFRPYVVNPGVATVLTFDQIRTDLAAIYIQCGMRPDVALVHPDVFRKLGALFDPQKQYQIRTDVVATRGSMGAVSFEGGIGAIAFDGCWFIEDKDATTGNIYYLNTAYCRMEFVPSVSPPGASDDTMDVSLSDGFVSLPLGATVKYLPTPGDADRAMMKTYIQLVVEKPNACGKRLNVSVA